ncbi:MAG: hypothetical protein IT427_03630 [Pirellulales bacterium]|nr:hypothetical protein [Pirellulales bacterium]
MPISVICPSCHARFQVSEKFAGKEGPCPKCKGKIKVPALEDQVIVHAPEDYAGGGKDSKGRPVLKPIARDETKAQPVMIAGIAAGALATVGIAWIIGRSGLDNSAMRIILSAGAMLLAPPLVMGAYSFLRNQELEPYRGKPLLVRVVICSLAYAALWGAIWGLKAAFLPDSQGLVAWNFAVLIAPPVAIGSLVALGAFDLDFGTGAMHYSCYLLVTMALRLMMNLPLL